MKYNSILRVGRFEDEGVKWVNISFVTPDHQEHELMVNAFDFDAATDFSAIPVEYNTHPACCEHPKGCPEKTNTEKLLEKFNKTNGTKRI